MAELYPTKTRLALLQAVADGQVYQGTWYQDEDFWADGVRDRNVTARMADLRRAGWVELGGRDPGKQWRRLWRLTAAGAAVLAASKESAS